MSGAAIRAASVAEVTVLAAIHHRSQAVAYVGLFPPGSSAPTAPDVERAWRRALDGPAPAVALVAELAGRVVGGVVARAGVDEPGLGHLQKLYVEPDVWGIGVGRQLHDAAVTWLAAAGVAAASLWVLSGNARARGCYERWGWQLDASPEGVFCHPGTAVTEVRYRRPVP